MWQGWFTLVGGIWLFLDYFFPTFQSSFNLMIVGIALIILGLWAAFETWHGIMIGWLGLWVLGSGISNYLELPVNFLLTGISIAAVGVLLATLNYRKKHPLIPH